MKRDAIPAGSRRRPDAGPNPRRRPLPAVSGGPARSSPGTARGELSSRNGWDETVRVQSMTALRIRCSSLVLSWLLCVTGVAHAQTDAAPPDPSSEAGKRAEGKLRYERGAAAYLAGRFKDAIDLFLSLIHI